MRTWKMMPGGWLSAAQNPETTVKVTNCWPGTIKWHKNWWRINWALTRRVNRLFSKIWERGTYEVRQLSNEVNFLLAVLAILQPANTDSLWPWPFLHPHLQWHGFAMPQCGVGAWSVRSCLWTLSWKWKHGTSSSGMYAIFCLLNSVKVPPWHMENFSRSLEILQCQQHKPFAGTKYFLKAESLLKMSSTADCHQHNGQLTTQLG